MSSKRANERGRGRFTSSWSTLPLAAATLALLSACVGEVNTGASADPQSGDEAKVAFRSLIDPSPGGNGNSGSSGDNSTQNPNPGAQTLAPPIKDQATLTLATISRCHASEVNHINKTLKPFINPGTGKPDKKFIVTLETGSFVIGHAEIDPADLQKTAKQNTAPNVVRKMTYAMDMTIPAGLGDGKEIDVYLFACVDLNGNKSCGDEGASTLQGFDFKSDVLYFIPLKASLNGGKLTLRRLRPDEKAQKLAGAAGKMTNLLKNLTFGQAGINESNPLGMVLTVRAAQARACGWGVRTNGCFVAGTRIDVGNGRTAQVETLPGGSALVTASGHEVRSLRAVRGPETHPVVELRTAAGHALTVTRTHPMLTLSGVKRAGDLRVGGWLVASDGTPTLISHVTRKHYSGQVYNFALPGRDETDHLVVANGLITGDLVLQQKLAQ